MPLAVMISTSGLTLLKAIFIILSRKVKRAHLRLTNKAGAVGGINGMSDAAALSHQMRRMVERTMARRRAAIEEVERGSLKPAEAGALILRDATRLAQAAARAAQRISPRRARLLWIKVRPEGWTRQLSFPLPLFLVRALLGLAGRSARTGRGRRGQLQAGPVEIDLLQARSLISSLPRCGRLLQVQDQGQLVEIWLT